MKIAAPVVIASRNPGKLVELRALCGDALELRLLPADDDVPEVEESADTYLGNALLKARAFAERSGAVSLADDSGLEVDALGGAPGVRSARFGGPGASDADRCRLLLEQLAARGPAAPRAARFRCVVVLADPHGESLSAEGVLEGEIALAPDGEGGFGYDPIFVARTATSGASDHRTLAQIDAAEKNRISHRAAAIRRLLGMIDRSPPAN